VETATALTANRTYTLPDASGTVALTSDIVVNHDATLTGNGTVGTPLGLDLTNANTWTGTQTLPVTAAQGDALIASTNAGTTTIDAARIGAGLTDAQVNDNLTINGGTVDATPIGATTPSTGAFTTVDASSTISGGSSLTLGDDLAPTPGTVVLHDNTILNTFTGTVETATALTANRTYTLPDASGTVALLSDITVTTNSTLLGDGTGGDPLRINLSNTNTWTGTQTFGQVGVLSIATFDADVTLGDSPTDAITMNGTLAGAIPLSFEGATSDVNETSFAITDPTADRTITFPDASGTVAFLSDIAVTTNSTLLGDGTGGDPLRINLTNANTWTGTQTLPVTAAQGDALIASTNAGTTTIDAARIGAGLTDAQVNDNLTINGGTVDATPIGATTPSTGAFTTISGGSSLTLGDDATPTPGTVVLHDNTSANTFTGTVETATALTANRTYTLPDASGTLALTSDVVVNHDATLTGNGTVGTPLGLDLTNANTWTGTQTLPVTAAQGDALIASTNAGTTTIDAARIGAGLTDAQVNDNVTIDGGTIDNTPIGGTTRSTANVTDLDANGTSTFGDGTGADNFTVNPGTGAVSFSGAVVTNVGTPTAGTDAANKDYVDTQIGTVWQQGGNAITTGGTGVGEQFLGTTNTQPLVLATTNTGTPQPILFATNNAEAMRLTEGGDLGIGTGATVNARLDVKGATATSGTNALLVENSASSALLSVDNDGLVSLRDGRDLSWGTAGINASGATLNLRGDLGDPTSGTIYGYASDIFMEADASGSNVQMLAGQDAISGDFSSAVVLQGDPVGGGISIMQSQAFSGGSPVTVNQLMLDATSGSNILLAQTNPANATQLTLDDASGLVELKTTDGSGDVTLTMTRGSGATLTSSNTSLDVSTNSTTGGDIALRGIATDATASGVAVAGVRAEGNATTTDANSNIALDLREGEFVVPRQANTAANAGGTNLVPAAEDDATVGDNGPSGVIDVTDGGIPGSASTTTGTLTVFNHYVKSNSIILLTPLDGGTGALSTAEAFDWSVTARGAGSFDITIRRTNATAGALSGGTSGTFRFGFLVINPGK